MPFILLTSLLLIALGTLVTQTHSHLFKGTKTQQFVGVLAIVGGFNALHWSMDLVASNPVG